MLHDSGSVRLARLMAWSAIVASLVAVATVAGCASDRPATGDAQSSGNGSEPAASFPVTVTDDASRTVTVETEPMRIVSLAPANTEIVAALGLEDRLVGVTTYDDYPVSVTSLPKVGDFVSPNMEAIAATDPDLVLATTGVQAETIGALEDLGATVVAVDPQSLAALYDSIEMVGRVTGASEKAAELVQRMQGDMALISSAAGRLDRRRVFIEIAQDPLFTAGKGTLLDELITVAGGDNVVAQEGYVAYSLEQLVKDDPDWYLATKGSMSDPSALGKRPGFDRLAAVQSGAIRILDDNLVSRPGPRVVLGALSIYEGLHPESSYRPEVGEY